jgi:hypothetical protein
MASVLALISKAVFEKLSTWKQVGEIVPLDRYTSKHAAFEQLAAKDALFLVTVRPKGAMLVAIIEAPKRKGDALVGKPNKIGLAYITDQIGKLKLADGKGITAKLDKLGMSLQTPRVLADADVALLRRTARAGNEPVDHVVQMKLPKKKTATGYPSLKVGKLSARAKQLVEDVYKSPDDRALRGVLADQLLEDQHVWGELISLQLTDPKKHAARIDAIIRQHAREIIGDIANVAARDSLSIVDGFLVEARCAKSKSFTSAPERLAGAKARAWATVKSVILTSQMPGTFVEALLKNPASSNLTKIRYSMYHGAKTLLERTTPNDPWSIVSTGFGLETALLALPAPAFARIPLPKAKAAQEMLEIVRAKRAKKR